ncbi:MAG: hypothetical protein ABI591_03540 [Kofleriaceae bacterium]
MSPNIDLSAPCEHVAEIKIEHVKCPGAGCVDCLKIGGWWIAVSVEVGESWTWCYVDERFLVAE